jgi:anti-sigma B factor antagonist
MTNDSGPYIINRYHGVTLFVFTLDRYLDAVGINQVGKAMLDEIDRSEKIRMVIDLQQVTHMSSAMLGKLIAVVKGVKKAKGDLTVCGLNKSIQPLFKVTKLDKLLTIKPDAKKVLMEYQRRAL